jgi:asparagine synthase (glutamine-hydrolysing)
MCGIAGTSDGNWAFLESTRIGLKHRGPDYDAIWRDENTGFGLSHTRLSVIDLSNAASQPMESACGRWILSYNGEVYNFRELRAELEAMGETFRSSGDTEVVLAVLRRDGTAGLARFAGMFAIALWDRQERRLLLARDRLGIKPLVYAPLPGGGLAFASEIHALRFHPDVSLSIDREALSEYLACLYVPAPRTIYQGIRKLLPGHVLQWQDGQTSIEAYWTPDVHGTRNLSADEAAEELLPLLRQSIASRIIADVPVGCFLSGGIDSAVIATLMAEASGSDNRILTFTMTFNEPAYDERRQAAEIARYIGAEHTELPASSDLSGLLDDHVQSFGEPFGNPTALLINDLSRKAREHVTVALVGDGGDEVFAGYPRYHGGLLARDYRRLPAWLRERVIGPLANMIPESSEGWHTPRRAREFLTAASLPDDAMYASWVEYFDPIERQRLLGESGAPPDRPIARLYRQSSPTDALDAMQATDLQSFLPGNLLAYGDAMSMRHALELRLPLLDHRIVEAVCRINSKTRMSEGPKSILRAIAKKLLPPHLLLGPKRGFNPPMSRWLKSDLAGVITERLNSDSITNAGLNWPAVQDLLHQHQHGRRDMGLKIWSLLTLVAWRQQVPA